MYHHDPSIQVEKPEETRRRYQTKLRIMNMFSGGVIMTVSSPKEAMIAEQCGARAIIPFLSAVTEKRDKNMPLMATDHQDIKDIMDRTLLPVIGRVRVGHMMEAKAMEQINVVAVDESTLLGHLGTAAHYPMNTTFFNRAAPVTSYSRAPQPMFGNVSVSFKDDQGRKGHAHTYYKHFLQKHAFTVPFMCPVLHLGDALVRIQEGASLVYTRPDGGSNKSENVATAPKAHDIIRRIIDEMADLIDGGEERIELFLKLWPDVTRDMVDLVVQEGRLPVPFFASGGIMTPIDVALCMALGCDGVILPPRIFLSPSVEERLEHIHLALEHYDDPDILERLFELQGHYGDPYGMAAVDDR